MVQKRAKENAIPMAVMTLGGPRWRSTCCCQASFALRQGPSDGSTAGLLSGAGRSGKVAGLKDFVQQEFPQFIGFGQQLSHSPPQVAGSLLG